MKIHTDIILVFAVLSNLDGSTHGYYDELPDPPFPPLIPAYITRIPLSEFFVAETPVRKAGDYNRIFNNVTERPEEGIDPFHWIKVEDSSLRFGVHEDSYSKITNIYTLPHNLRPHQLPHLKTYVAVARRIQFFVHKDSYGNICGASPPPNQIPRSPGYLNGYERHNYHGTGVVLAPQQTQEKGSSSKKPAPTKRRRLNS